MVNARNSSSRILVVGSISDGGSLVSADAGVVTPARASKSRRALIPDCNSASASTGNPITHGKSRVWSGQLLAAHIAQATRTATIKLTANSSQLFEVTITGGSPAGLLLRLC